MGANKHKGARRPGSEDEAVAAIFARRAQEPHYPIERLLERYGYEAARRPGRARTRLVRVTQRPTG